jgi:hypothetical protein
MSDNSRVVREKRLDKSHGIPISLKLKSREVRDLREER